jgi:hypothetical protein
VWVALLDADGCICFRVIGAVPGNPNQHTAVEHMCGSFPCSVFGHSQTSIRLLYLCALSFPSSVSAMPKPAYGCYTYVCLGILSQGLYWHTCANAWAVLAHVCFRTGCTGTLCFRKGCTGTRVLLQGRTDIMHRKMSYTNVQVTTTHRVISPSPALLPFPGTRQRRMAATRRTYVRPADAVHQSLSRLCNAALSLLSKRQICLALAWHARIHEQCTSVLGASAKQPFGF